MLYDFPLMAMAEVEVEHVWTVLLLALCTLIVLLVCWMWTLRLVRRLRREQLALLATPAMAGGPAGMVVPGTVGAGASAPVAAIPAASPDEVLPPVAVESDAARIRRRIMGISVSIVGGLVASFGGMVSLGLTLAFIIGVVRPEHAVDVIIGGIVSGLAPLAVGVFVFRKGVRHLNKKQ
jgi:hypothetical protein